MIQLSPYREFLKSKLAKACIVSLGCMLLTACANMGSGPQGGKKDETAPKCLSSVPTPNQKNVSNKKIVITFDEYIQLKDAYNKVVVSPPQKDPASISSIGKKVVVELQDSLIKDRTYIVDFGNAIADNNEGNVLENFHVVFSTGNDIDSFCVKGTIIDAATLAPKNGVYVGAYESLADSAFKKTKMDYIAKTNENGEFIIRGLKERQYNIFALEDKNNNFMFDDKSEGIAVWGQPIATRMQEIESRDTTYKDSATIDTIIVSKSIKYLPDTLLMRFYQETIHKQYYKNAVWSEKNDFVLNFVNEKKQLPKITPINFKSDKWYSVETGVTFDTLTYWITDTMVSNLDTIRFAIDYEKTDSASNFVAKRDTVTLTARKWKKDKKYKGPEFSISKNVEIYNKPVISWSIPLTDFTSNHVKLKVKEDTVWTDVENFSIEPIENAPREYRIIADFAEGATYRITIDTGKVTDMNGFANKQKLEDDFTYKAKNEYTKLDLKIKNINGPAFVELLNQSENVVKTVQVTNAKASFENITPGDYFVRLIEDANNDGKWTTGNYDEKTVPENVYYCPTKFSLRANWDREEDWDIKERPITNQRPMELRKKEKKKK